MSLSFTVAFIFFATETLDELSDQEDIAMLAGLTVKREGEKNTRKGVEGRIPLTYGVTRIECKKCKVFT